MSRLLDGGGNYEDCLVFFEETVKDPDGNTITRPADVGVPAKARFQPAAQSGTSARRAEQDNEGFESEQMYSIRFPRSFDDQYGELGAQSEIEWRDKRYPIFGDVRRYNGSRRTQHFEYLLRRY